MNMEQGMRIRIRVLIFQWLLLACTLATYAQSAVWTEISDNVPSFLPDGDFLDVQFIGEKGWIVFSEVYNNNGIILYTDDGGLSFIAQDIPQVPRAIDMVTEDIGFVGCSSGNVYYTSNGGNDWNPVSGILGSEIYGIDAINDPLVGYACGQNGWIAKFDTNQFLSQQQPFGSWMEHPDLFDVEFPADTNEGWVCGNKVIGHFSGGTWDSLSVPYCDSYYALSFIAEDSGWCAGGQGTLMKPVIVNTTDGTDWQEQMHPLIDQWLYDIFFLNKDLGWSVGMYILATINGGGTWEREAQEFMNTWNSVCAVEGSAVYVVGNNKRILKKDLLNSVREPGIPATLNIYPNPFTTATTIEYELNGNPQIQITIYNSIGEIVHQITQSPSHPVSQSPSPKVIWSPTHLPPGLYYAVLKHEEGVSVVKMIKQ